MTYCFELKTNDEEIFNHKSSLMLCVATSVRAIKLMMSSNRTVFVNDKSFFLFVFTLYLYYYMLQFFFLSFSIIIIYFYFDNSADFYVVFCHLTVVYTQCFIYNFFCCYDDDDFFMLGKTFTMIIRYWEGERGIRRVFSYFLLMESAF